MKRILILALVSAVMLSGCGLVGAITESIDELNELKEHEQLDLDGKPVHSSTAASIWFNAIIAALDNEDSEALHALFAPSLVAQVSNLDEQIAEIMELYKGKFVSKESMTDGHYGSVKYGTWLRLNISPTVRNLKTDEETYTIGFNVIVANDGKPDTIGLWYIYLENKNGDKCKAGDLELI
jgi:hypothetical protein